MIWSYSAIANTINTSPSSVYKKSIVKCYRKDSKAGKCMWVCCSFKVTKSWSPLLTKIAWLSRTILKKFDINSFTLCICQVAQRWEETGCIFIWTWVSGTQPIVWHSLCQCIQNELINWICRFEQSVLPYLQLLNRISSRFTNWNGREKFALNIWIIKNWISKLIRCAPNHESFQGGEGSFKVTSHSFTLS